MTKDELKKHIIELIDDFDVDPTSAIFGLANSEGAISVYVNGSGAELAFIVNRIAARDESLKKLFIMGLEITNERLAMAAKELEGHA